MGRLIVVQYTTIDGVVEDPDGSDGTPFGGWAMRYGPEGIAGDKFRLGEIMTTGVLLFGRRTWEHFATLWPPRDTPFAQAMNGAEKAVVTHRPLPGDRWDRSHAIDRPLAEWVEGTTSSRDVAVIGSHSVVRALSGSDLVDEYRLITFPTAIGAGRRLFPDATELALASTEQTGPAILAIYRVARGIESAG